MIFVFIFTYIKIYVDSYYSYSFILILIISYLITKAKAYKFEYWVVGTIIWTIIFFCILIILGDSLYFRELLKIKMLGQIFFLVLLILGGAFCCTTLIKNIYFLIILVLAFLLTVFLFDPVIPVLFQGHVDINMDNKYYKNNDVIPVPIEITGRKTNSTIYLYNISKTNELNQIDRFDLGPNRNETNIFGENLTLSGNVFSSGKYYIYIDTNNLTEGYYELVYKRSTDDYKYGKSFYLLNTLETLFSILGNFVQD